VNDYLEDFKIQEEDASNPVTFRHILTHTSGLPGDFGPHPVWGDTAPLPLKDYLSESLKARNPPLTKLVYSNMAFTLIAYLVEKFSGIDYKKYIQENIFDPIEMKDTAFFPKGQMEERLAIPYLFNKKTGSQVPATRLKANVWPAGIVYGTVINQARWLITNLNGGVYKGHRLISEETFTEMMTLQFEKFKGLISDGWLNETTGFGLTWWISERNDEKLFAHSGSVPGYTAFLVGNLDRKTGVAILTNGNRSHKYLFALAVKALDLIEEFKN
jgi:CubicO group peptidase (beta-lactamase class C family)